ncbi:hypothetical protein WJ96_03970 [Burkholderia ubonensis]|uniref:Uncharacterized protein n=1 Tax=Burkholderia ubonensis TaxID=101571 RepID=A0AAW3MT05_9BURK|nr:hypothetical protein [Burkholderia ubonensis]KVP65532.1 hypothetical protein WJ93_23715 [Burkholderia ubonensis]KVP97732.1 hypothetical protein WJ96_03970 [Burkholderia ubonensis]KVZ92429.1 hypothetical protein WL25_15625 [Burkholderia ubonensis]
MQRLRTAFKANSHLPVTVYLVAVVLYGLWSTMQHIHWTIPFLMVGGPFFVGFFNPALLGSPYLAMLNFAVAVVMAVYGLAQQLGLAWYTAVALVAAPLVVLLVLTKVLQWLLGIEQGRPVTHQD